MIIDRSGPEWKLFLKKWEASCAEIIRQGPPRPEGGLVHVGSAVGVWSYEDEQVYDDAINHYLTKFPRNDGEGEPQLEEVKREPETFMGKWHSMVIEESAQIEEDSWEKLLEADKVEVKKDEYLMEISPGTDKTPDELFKTIKDFGKSGK